MRSRNVLIVALAGLSVIGILLGALVDQCGRPSVCVDSITIVSTIPGNPSASACRPDQTMETENKMQGVVVRCVCRKAP